MWATLYKKKKKELNDKDLGPTTCSENLSEIWYVPLLFVIKASL